MTSGPGRLRGTILLVGPDGSGKSTVADQLSLSLAGAGVSVRRAHLRPGIVLPVRGDGSPVVDPHGRMPRGTFVSIVKLAAVLLDILAGRLVSWRPAARRGVLVLERGWWDQAVDPRRYRLPPSLVPLVRLLGRLTSRADVVALLHGDPDALHARKPEIGPAEVARQISAWRSLAGLAGRRVVEIDSVAVAPEAAAERLVRRLQAGALKNWRSLPAAPRLDLRATGSSSALGVYRPVTRRSAAAGATHRLLLHVPGRRCQPPFDGIDELPFELGLGADGITAFRSSALGRWVLGIGEHGKLSVVVKVGPHDDRGLRTEAQFLEGLEGSVTTFRAPILRWSGEWRDHFVVCTEGIQADRATVGVDAAGRIATALVRGVGGLGPVVHGDLAPWNLLRAGAETVLVDWESARMEAAPLFDLMHYVVRSGALLGWHSPDAATQLVAGEGGPGWRHLTDVGEDPTAAPKLAASYLDQTEHTVQDDREQSFRSALRKRLLKDYSGA